MLDNSNEPNDYGPVLEQANVPPKHRQLDKSQKIATAVLAFFAILVLLLWLNQTKQSLNPSAKKGLTDNQISENCPDGNCANSNSSTNLRQKDTDKDGLNDYDELYLHETSPYLEDSDSDGYRDYEEVSNGKDPNCPLGQDCAYIETAESSEQNNEGAIDSLSDQLGMDKNVNGVQEPIQPNQASTNSNSTVASDADLRAAQAILNGKGDAASLRGMLLSAGMDPETLNQISDEELMGTYAEILANN